MAKVTAAPRLDVIVHFSINESEARALDALAGYGDDAFVKAFYEKLGKAYMERHEEGLRTFLKSIRDVINPALYHIDEARKQLQPKPKGE